MAEVQLPDDDANTPDMPTTTGPASDDTNASPRCPNVVQVCYHSRTIGLPGDARVCSIWKATPKQLADTGANICLTDDLGLLHDVSPVAPITIGVAIAGNPESDPDLIQCTQMGYLPLPLLDGDVYFQPCYYHPQASDTIISPQAITSPRSGFTRWSQDGFSDGRPGSLTFYAADEVTPVMRLPLTFHDGLYYFNSNMLISSEHPPIAARPRVLRVAAPSTRTRADKHLEAETWSCRMGHLSPTQLRDLSGNVDGIPKNMWCHPFRHLDWKVSAEIRKQPAQRTAEHAHQPGQRFLMDFGFIRASTHDYRTPDPKHDRVIESFDGFTSYLIVVDEVSHYCWVFLCRSKTPPVELVSNFLQDHGLPSGGVIRTDQGGELARSAAFRDTMYRDHHYVVEPTGADSPTQNGMAERLNGSLGVLVRSLLYGAGLPAKFWSSALLHACYLYNRRVHRALGCTPFEALYKRKPNLRYLRTFGSRVAVRRPGHKRAKLDKHDYRGIFLGYTATDKNVRYFDLDSGVEKSSHHCVFDEAWYLHHQRPPAAQHLYDLGFIDESDFGDDVPDGVPTPAPFPPISSKGSTTPLSALTTHLPLGFINPAPVTAAAATVNASPTTADLPTFMVDNAPARLLDEYNIGKRDLAQVYLSTTPFAESFEEEIILRYRGSKPHATAGLSFLVRDDGRLYLAGMDARTPGMRIPRWRTRLKGAWLTKVGDIDVKTIQDVKDAFTALYSANVSSCLLEFCHTEVKDGLTWDGIPQVHLDQLNPRYHFNRKSQFDVPDESIPRPTTHTVDDGGVQNSVNRVLKLTRGKLLKEPDWDDWRNSEFAQLDQYMKQGMFGQPVARQSHMSIFHLLWTYTVKTVDNRKKARCVCDGSSRGGQVRILDHTYANGLEHTGARIFYSVAAAENLVVYGADVTNAFGEAGAPKQGFYVQPDAAFRSWWEEHLGNPPIPDGHVIPVHKALQGHPESPRLWEKHIDKILRNLGLTPTVHEPCLYSGIINNERVLFMRQCDDFACAAPTAATCQILFDLIDDQLDLPLKPLGLINLFNGVNIQQTKHYIKLSVSTWIEKICDKYDWLLHSSSSSKPLTPLPATKTFLDAFRNASGNPDPKHQRDLEKHNGFNYRTAIGELIYAMVSCRPDLSYAVTKCAQFSACPHQKHYDGVKNILRYLYHTRHDGIYFWRTTTNDSLPDAALPTCLSSSDDNLLLEGRPNTGALESVGFVDSDWAACVKTRRSFTGFCVRLAGGVVAYKSRLLPTVALSSTEAEFMGACDAAKVLLYVRSILWDIGIPQEAASLLYEDNDAATFMANANKPTPRTRHMDIRYFALTEWVERDLIALERVDTAMNLADHFSKQLPPLLFSRHVDHILGHVPPPYSPHYNLYAGSVPSLTHRVSSIVSDAIPTNGNVITPFISSINALFSQWTPIVRHRFVSSPCTFLDARTVGGYQYESMYIPV
eukprot:scaffold12494_cov159-Skeletonema_menzelii.AAC.1